jgi:hypothetical protein
MKRTSRPLADRLWEKILKKESTECWLWQGGMGGKGYGIIRKWNGEKWVNAYAHREVLQLTVGESAIPEAQALHSCDNPSCCNPNHLSWGTNSQNRKEARDRLLNQGNQKLTPAQVDQIREDTRTHVLIAQDYSVHFDTVARIKQGRAWQR